MSHSDNNGLILPPNLAPIQVVMIPIFNSDIEYDAIINLFEKIKIGLLKLNISCKIDARKFHKPGWKFAEYEMKGVPLRIAAGPRDLEKNTLEIARRDNLKKETISKVIDILLSVNQEMIYAIVSMDIEEDEAFTRIMADKNNGKNRRFNKDQKFTIDDLRKFSLFQKYLIETLNNKKIHFLEYDENQEDITKFIGKF